MSHNYTDPLVGKDCCYINQKHKYLFINISKNASTSIKGSLVFDKYLPYSDINSVEDFFKFVVIRNPLDRAISSYFEIRRCLRPNGRPKKYTHSQLWYKEAQKKNHVKSFEMFLECITENFYDGHCLPQQTFFDRKNIDLKQDMDIVLLMDFLPREFAAMCKKHSQLRRQPHKRLLLRNPIKAHGRAEIKKLVSSSKDIRKKILTLYPDDWEMYRNVKEARSKKTQQPGHC